MIRFKGAHFDKDMTLTCVRGYVAYPLSTRNLEEMMLERGVSLDHSTVNRWVITSTVPNSNQPSTAVSARWWSAGVWMRPLLS